MAIYIINKISFTEEKKNYIFLQVHVQGGMM